MDLTSAQTLVMFLSHRFKTTVPKVRYGKLRRFHGMYWTRNKGEIALVRDKIYADLVAHEFAHHLDSTRNPKVRRWHSDSFYYCLLQIIEAVGYKKYEYPWHKEYPHLLKWAVRDGLWPNKDSKEELDAKVTSWYAQK